MSRRTMRIALLAAGSALVAAGLVTVSALDPSPTGSERSGGPNDASPSLTPGLDGSIPSPGATSPSPLGVAGGKTIYPSPNISLPPDFVFASVSRESADEEPKPDGCEMRRRTICKIHFMGTYRLDSFDKGAIEVRAYEDDQAQPAHRGTLAIERKGGSTWFVDLPYLVSDTAKTVTFQAVLLGPDGKVIAEGAPHKYRIFDRPSPTP